MLKLKINYPTKEEEYLFFKKIAHTPFHLKVNPMVAKEEVLKLQDLTDKIYLDEQTEEYIVNIADATCNPANYNLSIQNMIRYGTLPQATIFLNSAAKAHAVIQGRWYVMPQDVKAVGMDVLRHRAFPTSGPESKEKSSEDIVKEILNRVEVP